MAGIKQLHKSILENLGAVYPTLFCQGSHPCRKRNVFADCSGVGCRPVCECINADDGTGGIFRNIKFMLGSGSWDFVPFILCHNEPSAGGIGNHLNGIIDTAAGGNASGKIRHSAVVFGSVHIRHECCGIHIFHGSASFAGGREALPPALSDFFAYVAEIVFIEVPTLQGDGILCFRIVIDIVVPSAPLELITAIV